jgi:hypothetical protein
LHTSQLHLQKRISEISGFKAKLPVFSLFATKPETQKENLKSAEKGQLSCFSTLGNFLSERNPKIDGEVKNDILHHIHGL